MIRLGERIVSGRGFELPYLTVTECSDVALRDVEAVRSCHVVMIDNIYDYAHNEIPRWIVDDHVRCIRPPFDTMYLDCHTVLRDPESSYLELRLGLWLQTGTVVRYVTKDDPTIGEHLPTIDLVNAVCPDDLAGYVIFNYWMANKYTKGRARFTGVHTIAAVREDGTIIHSHDIYPYVDAQRFGSGAKEYALRHLDQVPHCHFIAKLALTFMNTRNVRQRVATDEEAAPDRQPKKPSKRRGSEPTLKYHVLTVQGALEATRSDIVLSDPSGIRRAEHICRGHFREYRPERGKGLFGKGIYGNFFIHDHTRGDPQVGSVEKDYRVLPPKGE